MSMLARPRGIAGPPGFLALASAACFAVPLASSPGEYSIKDLAFCAAVFAVVLGLQLAVVRIVDSPRSRLRFAIAVCAAAAFAIGNWFHFFFVVTGWHKAVFAAGAAAIVAALAGWLASAGFRRWLTCSVALLVVIQAGFSALRPEGPPAFADAEERRGPARHSVYAIGIDSLVSRAALATLYGEPEATYARYLESRGFAVFDVMSPDVATLATFAQLLTYVPGHHPRTSRKFINGLVEPPLYRELRSAGFKIQFMFHNDYFGLDAGRIDSFTPEGSRFSACAFLDGRYGWNACKLIRSSLERGLVPQLAPKRPEDFVAFYTRHVRTGSGDEKWFSIAHLFFPAHTANRYSAADEQEREKFIAYYRNAQTDVVAILGGIVDHITSRDPDAIIFFFGDHGAFVTRGVEEGHVWRDGQALTTETVALDRQGVLAAVYPKDRCAQYFPASLPPGRWFQALAACAESAPLVRAP